MPTVPVGNEPVKVVDINDPQGIVYNRSTTVQVFFGSNASLCNRADASILDPNATIAVDTEAEVWAVAPSLTGGNTVTVDYQPHGAAYFRGLTAGLGSLVLQSIFSPNFVHLVSGWSINKDGSAEFNNLTIRGTFLGADFIINSAGLFLYNGTPALGNLVGSWAITAGTDSFGNAYRAGLNVDATTGTSYLQLLPGNPAVMAVGTGDAVEATPGEIRGIVLGSGSTRQVITDFRAAALTGENPAALAEFQLLSPTADLTTQPPSLSMTAQDGTNSAAVNVLPTEIILATALTWLTGTEQFSGTTIVPATPASNMIRVYSDANSGNGHLKYVSSDGVSYGTGRVIAHAANGASGQTISTVTFVAINGMSVNVGIGKYKFRVVVDLSPAAAAGRWEIAMTTTATVSATDFESFWKSIAGVVGGSVHQTTITNTQSGPNPSVIGGYSQVFEGFVQFSTAGTMSVTAATTVAADTFTVWDGSTIELEAIV